MTFWQRLFSRKHLYEDLSNEMQEHLEERTDELMRAGLSRPEALAAARREFGNAALLQQQGRDVWRWAVIEDALRDLRYGLRQLWRSPGYSLTVLLIFALAIGANTAVFSAINSLLLRPLPYPEPDHLAALTTHRALGGETADNDPQDGETWELVKNDVPAARVAAYSASANGVNLLAGNSLRYVREQRVSADYFPVLGIRPLIGRSFTPEEDVPHGPNVAILSFELWKSVFGDDWDVVGKTLHLKGEPYTVVGVLPKGAHSTAAADVWTPLRPHASGEGSGTNYRILIRLRDGANWEQVNAQLAALRPSLITNFLKKNPAGTAYLLAQPLQQRLAAPVSRPVLLLMGSVVFILLIACANLAGLLLVRVDRRASEISTRIALGANRAAIARQFFMEPLALAALGGALGIGGACFMVRLLEQRLPGDLVPVGGLSVDWRVIGFGIAASLAASVLTGLLPAMKTLSIFGQTGNLSARERARAASQRRPLLRQFLIAGEVTLTLVLLAGTGLFVRTLAFLETLPPGFNPHDVMTAKLSLNDARYDSAVAFHKLLRESVAKMQSIPGVESAAVGLSLPYEYGMNNWSIIADGNNKGHGQIDDEIYVTPGYFRVLQMPMIAGRSFNTGDTTETQPVMVVNESFAQRYLGGANGIGRHVRTDGETYEVVGIVGNVTKLASFDASTPLVSAEPTCYLAAEQFGGKGNGLGMVHVWMQPSWIVRTKGPFPGLTAAMQHALGAVDPELPFSGFQSMEEVAASALEQQRVEVDLLGLLAILALVLCVTGIYGLVSNLIARQTREIGIRMALGSTVSRAMTDIARPAMLAVIAGSIAGLGLTCVAVHFLRSQVYGVRPYDPVTFATVLGVLIATGVFASALPALRIARINPASTLRAE